MSRYDGKPLLRLLECYVLDAIGELQSKDRKTLEQMSPKLREVYAVEGEWRDIIVHVMRFPPNIDDEFRRLWDKNREIAAQNDQSLSSEEFARMIVDENFNSE